MHIKIIPHAATLKAYALLILTPKSCSPYSCNISKHIYLESPLSKTHAVVQPREDGIEVS
jgi:hypothetical protein